ncbi:MAG: DUF1236 domain-containing protein [Hyphomicrobium sp.]|nr:DUF1236 domain-containing protein [Hyphomicrobium sp.]MBN9277048.1 DUF1236 domain-containing protein [Hyphomicrobium sp.]
MKHQLLRTASVCALIVAMGGGAFAQTGGPGGGDAAGPSQTEQKRPDSGGGGDMGRQGGSGETVQPKGGSAGQPTERQPGSQDRQRTGQEQRGQEKDRQRTGQEQRGQDKDRARTGQEQRGLDKDRQRTGQEQRGQDKERTRTGQEQRGQDKDRARTGQDQRDRGDRTRQGQADRDRGGVTQLSERQRTTVRERFTRSGVERNRVTNVNFDIRVGASVPRSVVLHPLPADIVEIVPAYRGYRYVYVRDEIVIVNPATFAVVAVVSGSGNQTAGVRDRRPTLAQADRVFVRDHIDRGAAIRLGIGDIRIGMAVPQGVELLPLPSVVVERVPDLREYRYFVYDDDIAIVDPSSDEIALIVEK